MDILVVDDEPDVRDMFQKNLETHGFCVRAASSTVEGMQEIKKRIPDLIILDIRLGVDDTTGFELCRAIKGSTNVDVRGIIVVLKTKFDDIDCETGMVAGADSFIRSPIDLGVLRIHLRTLVQARASASEVARLKSEEHFSEGFAHDLNNVLAVAFFAVESIPAETPGMPYTIIAAAQECVRLARRYLRALSARGRGENRRTVIDCWDVVLSCVSVRTRKCTYYGIELKGEDQRTTRAPLNVDEWTLTICIIELIENAIKEFALCKSEGVVINTPQIVLSVKDTEDFRVRIEVADNGRGIPVEKVQRIWEKGFTDRKSHGGTGLGLWLVKARLGEMGASIHYCPNAPTGSVFVLMIPRSMPEHSKVG